MNDEWHYLDGTNSVGPMDATALRAALTEGRITRETLVWRQGMEGWSPIRVSLRSVGPLHLHLRPE